MILIPKNGENLGTVSVCGRSGLGYSHILLGKVLSLIGIYPKEGVTVCVRVSEFSQTVTRTWSEDIQTWFEGLSN